MIIYKTLNKINGKIYIGKSVYEDADYFGSGKLLKRAIAKYGKKNFVKTVLERCDSVNQLNEREIYWIKTLNSSDLNIGYNITNGGSGGDTISNHPNRSEIIVKLKKRRYKMKELSRINISNALKGIPKSDSHKAKLSQSLTGKTASLETKQKLSNMRKGRFCGKDNSMYGKKAWNSGMKMGDEFKNKLKGPREKVAGKNNGRYIEISAEQIDIIKNNYGLISKARIKKQLLEKTGLKICSDTLNKKINELGLTSNKNRSNI